MDFAEVIFMSGYKSGYSTKNRRKNLRFYVDFSMELMGVELHSFMRCCARFKPRRQ